MQRAAWAVAVATFVVTGCGGGGGGGSDSASPAAKDVAVVGTITGFGSVVIDGVHYETESAEIEIDDHGGHHQDDLSVGQVVSIDGHVNDDGSHHADHVRYEAEVQGAVQSIDTVNGTLVAVGQTIAVSDATVFSGIASIADLAVGDRIEVSGSRDAAGVVQASFVKKEAAEDGSEVRGTVANLDTAATTFTIGDVTVNYGAATLVPTTLQVANGLVVEVEGALAGGVLTATKVKQEHPFEDRAHGDGAEVEGLVVSVGSGGSFVIDNVTVTTSSATVYRNGTAADVVVGARLEAEGAIAADGSLAATKVSFKTASIEMLEGDVEAVSTANATLTLFGQTIAVTSGTVFRDDRDHLRTFALANLSVGDHVEVATGGSAGALQALRIERDKASTRDIVRGPVSTFDATAGTLTVSGFAVDASSAQYRNDETAVTRAAFFGALAAGTEVKARGTFASGVLTATEVEIDHDVGDDRGHHGGEGGGGGGGGDDGGGDDHGGH